MHALDIGLIKVAPAPVHKADLADLTPPASTHTHKQSQYPHLDESENVSYSTHAHEQSHYPHLSESKKCIMYCKFIPSPAKGMVQFQLTVLMIHVGL